ncbi:hypothetical protein AVEN_112991-1, partial [Araneus ventricosus]
MAEHLSMFLKEALRLDEILEPYVRLFRGAVGPEFILMDNNARPHRALLVDEFLE